MCIRWWVCCARQNSKTEAWARGFFTWAILFLWFLFSLGSKQRQWDDALKYQRWRLIVDWFQQERVPFCFCRQLKSNGFFESVAPMAQWKNGAEKRCSCRRICFSFSFSFSFVKPISLLLSTWSPGVWRGVEYRSSGTVVVRVCHFSSSSTSSSFYNSHKCAIHIFEALNCKRFSGSFDQRQIKDDMRRNFDRKRWLIEDKNFVFLFIWNVAERFVVEQLHIWDTEKAIAMENVRFCFFFDDPFVCVL